MVRIATVAAVLAMAGAGVTPVSARAELPRWFAGCWSGSRDGEQFTERWIVADEATMIGTSHTVKGGRLSAFEFLRVVREGRRGCLHRPAGRRGADRVHRHRAVADRDRVRQPAHDFPKRVGYRLVDATHLTAWIDGGAAAAARASSSR